MRFKPNQIFITILKRVPPFLKYQVKSLINRLSLFFKQPVKFLLKKTESLFKKPASIIAARHSHTDESLQEEAQNPWWNDLVKRSSGNIFVSSDDDAKKACETIRESYSPILQEYGVDIDHFFWGSIKTKDAESLYSLVRHYKPETVYQVGTFVGYSAMILAHALKANGKGRLIAVDPEMPHRTFINPVDVAKRAASVLGLDEQIEFVTGCHSVSMGDSIGHNINSKIPVVGRSTLGSLGCKVDLAFIDGDHSVSATICDFMAIKDYLAVGGICVFHDVYSWPSVAHALQIILDDNYYHVNGASSYFSFDTSSGWDGLAAMLHKKLPVVPTVQINISSEKDNSPVSCAIVDIPSVGIPVHTDDNGRAYIFNHTIPPNTVIKVSAKGYIPSSYSTLDDYETICIQIKEECECQLST